MHRWIFSNSSKTSSTRIQNWHSTGESQHTLQRGYINSIFDSVILVVYQHQIFHYNNQRYMSMKYFWVLMIYQRFDEMFSNIDVSQFNSFISSHFWFSFDHRLIQKIYHFRLLMQFEKMTIDIILRPSIACKSINYSVFWHSNNL